MDFNLDWLYSGFAWVLIQIHWALGHIFDPGSGYAWGFSIVILTVMVRIVVFPLFVKQIRSQRAMAQLQPQIKELQQKYKGDKQKQQQEQMKLFKENGANPLSGCLPIVAQAPFLYAMYRVLRTVSEDQAQYGLSQKLVNSAAHAKIFGVPLGLTFKDSAEKMQNLGADPTLAKTVIIIFVIVMAVTTYIAQRQLMIKQQAQQAAAGQSTPFQQQQKLMLFMFPAMFLIWGFFFPMGLIAYWTTSNLWTMGQQYWVLKRIPHQAAPGGSSGSSGTATQAGKASAPANGTSGSAGKSSNGTAPKGADKAGDTSPMRLFKRRRAEPEPTAPPPAPKVVRNQRTRAPRSKRSGQKKKS
ncbi:MAG: membrane protein insertase YidC [Streptosporangiales bacterium]